jgi:hypothetical protein
MRPSTTLVLAAMLLSLAACDERRARRPVGGTGAGSAGTMAIGTAASGGMGAGQPGPTALDSGIRTPLEPDAAIPDSGNDMTATDGGDAAIVANDATIDADTNASTCTFEAKLSTRCTASLCAYEGDSFVVVRSTENLTAGALGWSASVCERALGWGSAGSFDGTLFIYGLSLADLRELEAGAPVFLYYAGPSEPPIMEEAEECPLERSQQIPACPETDTGTPKHRSKLGCRGPLDPNCEACQVGPNLFLTSADGADWYDSSSVFRPAACDEWGYCLGCASCSYRDEDEARALGERPECEPCPPEAIADACFYPEGCECWCSRRSRLRAACPTVVP